MCCGGRLCSTKLLDLLFPFVVLIYIGSRSCGSLWIAISSEGIFLDLPFLFASSHITMFSFLDIIYYLISLVGESVRSSECKSLCE